MDELYVKKDECLDFREVAFEMKKIDQIIGAIKRRKSEFEQKYNIKGIGVFGSYIKGCQKQDSDIDIVVKLSKQDLFEIIGIQQDLEEEFHCSVDVVSYREKMNPFLRHRIDQEAIYV